MCMDMRQTLSPVPAWLHPCSWHAVGDAGMLWYGCCRRCRWDAKRPHGAYVYMHVHRHVCRHVHRHVKRRAHRHAPYTAAAPQWARPRSAIFGDFSGAYRRRTPRARSNRRVASEREPGRTGLSALQNSPQHFRYDSISVIKLNCRPACAQISAAKKSPFSFSRHIGR